MKKIDSQHLDDHLTLGEEIANAITHGIGVLLGITALVLGILRANNGYALTGAIIFGVSIILLYLMSTLYHAFPRSMRVKKLFERFDHIFIYVLIGGSFSPILLTVVKQPLGFYLCLLLWIVISFAITIKAVKFHSFHMIHVALYLILGWSALGLILPLYHYSKTALILLMIGGLSYTIGVPFYVFKWFKYSHFVWHLFVLAGTIFHFFSIYLFVL